MDPLYKGAIFSGALTVLGVGVKLLLSYIWGLQAKIKVLKAQEQRRWEDKVDKLELALATTNALVAEMTSQLRVLNSLVATVDKLSKDIHGFHVWKRTKFPEGAEDLSQ